MAGLPPEVFSLLAAGLKGLRAFEQCRIPNCTGHSLGIVCQSCSRFVCQSHAYVSASIPPRPICASCIIDDHQDLLETEIDPDVIEATVVE